MKNKTLIFILLCVLKISSCSNLLHVEKRQYRKGFHIDNFFALNKQKNILLSLNDTTLKQSYTKTDSFLEEEIITKETDSFVTINSIITERQFKTAYNPPIILSPKKDKIKDEDPDEEEEVKPNVFDIITSVFGLISISSSGVFLFLVYLFYDTIGFFPAIPFLILMFAIPLTVLFFLIGRIIDIIQKKEKNKLWNKRAWISFILTIVLLVIYYFAL